MTAVCSSGTPIPLGKQDIAKDAMQATKANLTPSWTSIVEAYHKEGNGDREMLLALLNAKAKEDERLAALDLLRAEQMRAYTTHIAIHGPLYPQLHYPSSSSSSSHAIPSAMPIPSTSAVALINPIVHLHAKTNSTSARSRAPSLTNSVSSRTSSPLLDDVIVSPRDAHSVIMTAKDHASYNSILKRKWSAGDETPAPAAAATKIIVTNEERSAKRTSPIVGSRRQSPTLPSMRNFMPPVAPLASPNSSLLSSSIAHPPSPPSLQHILNSDLRPLSSTRVATSDLRSSSSSDEE